MQVFLTIVLVIGILLVSAFFVYEIIGLVRDIKKQVAKKKAKKVASNNDEKVIDENKNK